ncbi:hypothetical protein AGLY_012769 [Aphis glycines]|uniref:Uncharacterized protein n=1 Tax=Aphis glycines TaxID=307491 RepID=A0A6G0T9D7_APHGL|nr:hypothetical protein AGLY_012769 [Aphis glycines]
MYPSWKLRLKFLCGQKKETDVTLKATAAKIFKNKNTTLRLGGGSVNSSVFVVEVTSMNVRIIISDCFYFVGQHPSVCIVLTQSLQTVDAFKLVTGICYTKIFLILRCIEEIIGRYDANRCAIAIVSRYFNNSTCLSEHETACYYNIKTTLYLSYISVHLYRLRNNTPLVLTQILAENNSTLMQNTRPIPKLERASNIEDNTIFSNEDVMKSISSGSILKRDTISHIFVIFLGPEYDVSYHRNLFISSGNHKTIIYARYDVENTINQHANDQCILSAFRIRQVTRNKTSKEHS